MQGYDTSDHHKLSKLHHQQEWIQDPFQPNKYYNGTMMTCYALSVDPCMDRWLAQ